MDFYEQIWEQVSKYIKENVDGPAFDMWIKPLRIHEIKDDIDLVYVEVPTGRGQEIVIKTIKGRYINYIEKGFNLVMGRPYRVVLKAESQYSADEARKSASFDVKNDENSAEEPKPVKRSSSKKLNKEKLFNPQYTFDNFVVGSSNNFAWAAASAVASSPAQAYNPLFIYGGSGLGKTHLMHAIGTQILSENPDMKVLYVSSEMFTTEVIDAMNVQKMQEFKNKYRSVDVLLIDDIQFLEGKKSTQEEFFWTFDMLYNLNKQIVISSDRPVDKLEALDKRLTSRFSMSLVADIQPPNYETRVAILKNYAKNKNIELNDDVYEVICLISEKIKDNIRELEGAFNRIIALSVLMNEKIDKQMAKKALKDIMQLGESVITPEKIKKIVCKKYGIKVIDLESSKKTNDIAYPRQIAMYLIREMTDFSLPEIGKFFGGRHHTTVKYAHEKIQSEIKYNEELKKIVDELKLELKEN